MAMCAICLFKLPPSAQPLVPRPHPDRMLRPGEPAISQYLKKRYADLSENDGWAKFGEEPEFDHDLGNPEDLLAWSASRGCFTCAAILSFVTESLGHSFWRAVQWRKKRDRPPELHMHDPRANRGRLRVFELYTPTLSSLEDGFASFSGRLIVRTGKHLTTYAQEGLIQAADWLTECSSDHDSCRGRDTGFTPTRLLFIGDRTAENIGLIENSPQNTQYATLSHRWSPETEKVKLLESNYGERLNQGLPLRHLPQMMRDIIEILRYLHFSFVWVDCLCIIQDSEDNQDWRSEAQKMGSVYGNSALTIAATSCDTSSRSVFSAPARSHIQLNQGDENVVFMRRKPDHFWDIRNWMDSPNNPWINQTWPLLPRGWVFQERVLSPRVLHITHDELLWECNHKITCECWSTITHEDNKGLCCKNQVSSLKQIHWTDIVEEYSSCGFTYHSDRLPALAGIARRWGELNGGETYHCGLWQGGSSIASQLLWHNGFGSAWLRPRVASKLPSWSWASVEGPIKFGYEQFSLGSQERKWNPQITSACEGDVYMCESMDRAEIIITAQVFPATLVYDNHGLNRDQRRHCLGWIETGQHGFAVQHLDYAFWHKDEHFVRSGSHVLGLLYHWKPRTGEEKGENVGFLVLHESAEAGKYRRIGLGDSSLGFKLDTRVIEDIIEEKTIILI
ncbi:hypothetical protein INS49_009001 [Diaporthe citri]|uniref:uncharacterized protein n=1 Tax=Diaporthe citri TaxID=83186 RepID=UPI001C81C36C|nr:uncharacterized protein INS49_009001 [Diaporthe citri]KAG6363898.1 hypothetical protein INS49_009001 [Diaporthe citri]